MRKAKIYGEEGDWNVIQVNLNNHSATEVWQWTSSAREMFAWDLMRSLDDTPYLYMDGDTARHGDWLVSNDSVVLVMEDVEYRRRVIGAMREVRLRMVVVAEGDIIFLAVDDQIANMGDVVYYAEVVNSGAVSSSRYFRSAEEAIKAYEPAIFTWVEV